MGVNVPAEALPFGFVNQPPGTHTSRTLMLSELTGLVEMAGAGADYKCFQGAAIDMNAVRKLTLSTRQKTFRHLRELYGLSPSIVVCRALMDLWTCNSDAQPLLAALCSTARDPLVRAGAQRILEADDGDPVTAIELQAAVERAFPGRYRPDTLARTGRNLASTFTQSGHLRGRTHKLRSRAVCTPATTAYALVLGHLCGSRGQALFQSLWAKLCDAPEHVLRSQAEAAARLGYLDYSHGGGIVDIGFRHLLRTEETAR